MLRALKLDVSSPLAGLQHELGRMRAAMWTALTLTVSPEQLVDHLRHMAQREVTAALQDADTALAGQPAGLDGGRG